MTPKILFHNYVFCLLQNKFIYSYIDKEFSEKNVISNSWLEEYKIT